MASEDIASERTDNAMALVDKLEGPVKIVSPGRMQKIMMFY